MGREKEKKKKEEEKKKKKETEKKTKKKNKWFEMNSNTPAFEMKLDYLRLCSRASDNPGFIWSRGNGCVFFWFVAGAEGTPPLVRWGFGPTEPRAAPPLKRAA